MRSQSTYGELTVLNDFLFASAWLVVGVLLSLLYRIFIKGKFPKSQEGAIIFHEAYVSGRSYRNALTRAAGAGLSLVVELTEHELSIRPLVWGRLMFIPEIFDLEHRIDVHRIISIRESSWWGLKSVIVEFSLSERSIGRFEICVRRRDVFRSLLEMAANRNLSSEPS